MANRGIDVSRQYMHGMLISVVCTHLLYKIYMTLSVVYSLYCICLCWDQVMLFATKGMCTCNPRVWERGISRLDPTISNTDYCYYRVIAKTKEC